jgi:hypothetical protein
MVLKPGDIIKTGNASKDTIRYLRITKQATPNDLRYLTKVQSYLVVREGRQPPVSVMIQTLGKLMELEKDGKLKIVSVKQDMPKQQSSDKILNPATGRYVLKTGKIGKELLKKTK